MPAVAVANHHKSCSTARNIVTIYIYIIVDVPFNVVAPSILAVGVVLAVLAAASSGCGTRLAILA